MRQNRNNKKFYAEHREREKQRVRAWRLENKDRCKQANKAWRESNKERLAETKRLWREGNVERVMTYAKDYYAKNKEAINAACLEYKAANREKLNADVAEYYRNHPEVNRANRSRRRAREKQALAAWADDDKINAIYAEAIRLSRETGIRHDVDHIYPLKSDLMCGLHVETNLQILTAAANRSKRNNLPTLSFVALQ